MKKMIKWGAIIIGALLVLIIAALLIVPRFIDVQQYKPMIEKKVAEATGRPFTLDGDLSLSLFPWAGLSEKSKEKPRTDFTELHIPFMLKNGAVHTPKTSLLSPLIRVTAAGDANLVQETLNFRVEPKFVANLKGQGDTTAYSGLMAPVLVGGTFSAPKFRPDLAGMLKGKFPKEILKPGELKKLIPGQSSQEKSSQKVEETIKGLFKSFPRP